MASSTECGVDIIELGEAEAAEMFDRVCRRQMRISGEQFLEQWRRGDYEGVDLDSIPGLVEVWMTLPAVQ